MAEEKTIVLKIETITDQAVMEAYGKTLNSVLGSYEENTAMISEYTNTIKANQEAIKALQKEGERWGGLTEKQAQRLANLTAENEKLKIAKAELVQITKNQIKVDTTEVGSMENKSQLLGKLRMAWRKMTDEQKLANQGMLETIQQLDKSLKASDGNIGNFQRNVGDYRGAIGDFIGQFPKLGGAITKFASPAGAIGVATGAFNLLKTAMKATQNTGDAIQNEVAAWSGTWDRFLRMIATADFSNFIGQLTGAYDAAKELAEVRDEMFEKENSIRLLKAKQSKEEQLLLMTMRDQTKSEEERIKAGQRYQELVMQNAQLQRKAYEELADAELTNLARQTGATDENLAERKKALREWITYYATADAEQRRKTEESLRKEKNELEASMLYVDQWTGRLLETKDVHKDARIAVINELLAISDAYNKADENIITTFVNAEEKALRAESNAIASAQRAATMVNSLTAKAVKDAIVEIDTSDAMTKMIKTGVGKMDVGAIKREFAEILREMEDEVANDPALAKVAESPIARALGVSDEELKKINDHAMSGAGQIFNSISQLSKDATQRRLNDELDAIDKESESEKKILEGKLEKGIISQKEYEKKLGELDEQTAAKKEQVQKEAFEKNKRWNIAQALMNGALAITKVLATTPFPASLVMAGVTAATTAANVATIALQKYARGGELHGPSHAQGGIKGFVGNRHIEAEGGEVIINKRSSAKHRKLLSLINSDNGWGDDFAHARGSSGRFFARGGVIGGYDFRTSGLPDSNSTLSQIVRQQTDNLRQSFDAINRRIDNLRVSVLLSDIEAKSNEKRVHISRAVL